MATAKGHGEMETCIIKGGGGSEDEEAGGRGRGKC